MICSIFAIVAYRHQKMIVTKAGCLKIGIGALAKKEPVAKVVNRHYGGDTTELIC